MYQIQCLYKLNFCQNFKGYFLTVPFELFSKIFSHLATVEMQPLLGRPFDWQENIWPGCNSICICVGCVWGGGVLGKG